MDQGRPRISLVIELSRIKPEQTTSIEWSVDGSESVSLWSTTVEPLSEEPTDWWRVARLGTAVEPSGRLEVSPTETTAYFVVTRTERAVAGEKVVLEVDGGDEHRPRPSQWCSPDMRHARMEEAPHVGVIAWPHELELFGRYTAEELLASKPVAPAMQTPIFFAPPLPSPAPPTPPQVNVTVTASVIFEDETTSVSWTTSKDASCVTTGLGGGASGLVADTSQLTGVRADGGSWGGGGSPGCGAPTAGQHTIGIGDVVHFSEFHGCVATWGVSAANAQGGQASQHRVIDILGLPTFSGACSPARQNAIKAAVKDVCARLRKGSLLNNGKLDSTVDAFKTNYISRVQLWSRLMVALQNLHLVTFSCHDFANDKDNYGGQWNEYGNEIKLGWSPNYQPYLEYVILHELIHKCGFNGTMMSAKNYSNKELEIQNHRICCSVYSNCGMCGHPDIKGQF